MYSFCMRNFNFIHLNTIFWCGLPHSAAYCFHSFFPPTSGPSYHLDFGSIGIQLGPQCSPLKQGTCLRFSVTSFRADQLTVLKYSKVFYFKKLELLWFILQDFLISKEEIFSLTS